MVGNEGKYDKYVIAYFVIDGSSANNSDERSECRLYELTGLETTRAILPYLLVTPRPL